MTSLLASAAFLLPLLIGFLVVSPSWEPGTSGPGRLAFRAVLAPGMGIGIASGAFFLWLTTVGSAGRGLIAVEAALALALLSYGYLNTRGVASRPPGGKGMTGKRYAASDKILPGIFSILCLLSVAAFALLVRNRPHGGWDAWAIWNTRARFLFRGGERWADAMSPLLAEIHPDYPLLVPGFIARAWTYVGSDSVFVPAAVAFLYAIATVTFLVWAVGETRGWAHGLSAGILLLGTTWFLRHGASQYMDIPVAYYLLCTVALLYLGGRKPERRSLPALAGVSAGMACWTKNEGILFLAAVLAAGFLACLLLSRKWRPFFRDMARFAAGVVPFIAIVIYFKVALAPPSDLVAEFDLKSALGKLSDPLRYWQVATAWGKESYDRFPLAVLFLYPALSGVRVGREERAGIAAAAGALGLVALAYFFIYVITSKPLQWHLETSLARLLLQLWPTLLFVCFLFVAPAETAGDSLQPVRGKGERKKNRK